MKLEEIISSDLSNIADKEIAHMHLRTHEWYASSKLYGRQLKISFIGTGASNSSRSGASLLVEFEGKYKGDAMNIAARIQQNAIESEVWMSESVYLAVRGKTKFNFSKVGLQNFKNIKEPITIYSISG